MNIILMLLTLVVMETSEKYNKDTRLAYEEFIKGSEIGKPWEYVRRFSLASGLIIGSLTILSLAISSTFLTNPFPEETHVYITIMATAMGYISGQVKYTDVEGLQKADRFVLRIGMLLSLISIVSIYYTVPQLQFNVYYVITIYLLAIIVFLFIHGIGASDARAMMIGLTFVSILSGLHGIYLFLFVLVYIYIAKAMVLKMMGIKKKVAITIYFVLPYAVYLIVYPLVYSLII